MSGRFYGKYISTSEATQSFHGIVGMNPLTMEEMCDLAITNMEVSKVMGVPKKTGCVFSNGKSIYKLDDN